MNEYRFYIFSWTWIFWKIFLTNFMIIPLDSIKYYKHFDLHIDYISIYIRRIKLENIFKMHIIDSRTQWDDGYANKMSTIVIKNR